jgi:glutamyl-tRNA reductase
MRVAAGLDSLIIGEAQILGQVSQAAARALNAGSMLARTFTAAVTAGKRARSQTAIGRHTLSISHAGVMLARRSHPALESARVLVIGAGEMARLAVAALRAHEAEDICIINRSIERGQALAQEAGTLLAPWSGLHEAVAAADVVIAATSSPRPLIGKSHLGDRVGPLTMIDLGMPRNIDPATSDIAGVELFDIDDLQQIVEQNRGHRRHEIVAVEALIDAEMDKLREQLRAMAMGPIINQLRQRVQSVVDAELDRALGQIGPINETTRQAIDRLAHRIASKVLHEPMMALRSPDGPQIAPVLCGIFGIHAPNVAKAAQARHLEPAENHE